MIGQTTGQLMWNESESTHVSMIIVHLLPVCVAAEVPDNYHIICQLARLEVGAEVGSSSIV